MPQKHQRLEPFTIPNSSKVTIFELNFQPTNPAMFPATSGVQDTAPLPPPPQNQQIHSNFQGRREGGRERGDRELPPEEGYSPRDRATELPSEQLPNEPKSSWNNNGDAGRGCLPASPAPCPTPHRRQSDVPRCCPAPFLVRSRGYITSWQSPRTRLKLPPPRPASS